MNNVEPAVRAMADVGPTTGVIILATAAIVVVGMALAIIWKILPKQS